MQIESKAPLAGRTLVVVLGMHRSGTSAVAACLHALGLWAGHEKELLGATPENARGYWELRALVELNEALLTALGSSWDAPAVPPLASLGAQDLAEFSRKAQELLQTAFGNAQALVLKDPRLCRLLDFWIPQFEQAGLQTRYVLVLRYPQEVAASIHRRDKLPLTVARWLWADHMAWACVQTAGRERLVVSYSGLLAKPQQELTRLAEFVGLSPQAADAMVRSQIDPALRHHSCESPSDWADVQAVAAGGADEEQGADASLQRIDEGLYAALLPLAVQPAQAPEEGFAGGLQACKVVRQMRAGERHTALDVLPSGGIAPVKTAVLLHLFYPEQWSQFLALWERVWPDIDLLVTVSGPHAQRAKMLVQSYDPSARVFELENRGRDVAGFLQLLPLLVRENYVCVCKLHTKRSDYADIDGQGWRLDLWSHLLPSGQATEHIRARFGIDQRLGMLGLQDYWLAAQDFLDSRQDRVVDLATRLAPEEAVKGWHFFAGTMFWFRPSALRPLLELNLDVTDFEVEQGQREGTLAHAVERVLALAVRASGHYADLTSANGRQQGGLPVAFARNSAEQLLDELRRARERLSAVETALAEAQRLAIERMEHIEVLDAALAEAQRLTIERMEHIEVLDAALAEAQRLALERMAVIEAFNHSVPGKLAEVMRRIGL